MGCVHGRVQAVRLRARAGAALRWERQMQADAAGRVALRPHQERAVPPDIPAALPACRAACSLLSVKGLVRGSPGKPPLDMGVRPLLSRMELFCSPGRVGIRLGEHAGESSRSDAAPNSSSS